MSEVGSKQCHSSGGAQAVLLAKQSKVMLVEKYHLDEAQVSVCSDHA